MIKGLWLLKLFLEFDSCLLTKKCRFDNLYSRISTRTDRVLTEVIIMLTERQLQIFQVIIDEFIESAHPVGSRAISEKENINVSAATIRNVMAELENMGFLEKTHSSSGRVPSEKGRSEEHTSELQSRGHL